MLAVGGCAAPATEQAKTSDPITESDEPEHRRRARIRMELAVGYFEQGKTSIALDELKQVILADPTFPDAFNLRGLVYMRMNDMGQAEDSFRRAVALNPRDANTLHNLGWLQCQQRRYDDAQRSFEQALNSPIYGDRAKTLMAQGLCLARAGKPGDAERSLSKAYELDAGNPIIGYNLANLLYARGDLQRAQFYIRRLNNTELANAETLWLGVKVERKIGDQVALAQLGEQLRKRYPQSREVTLLDKGAFDD
nr:MULTISPECIES: type IV pilus biogenesis/stability protein PilW [Ramlibacter]